MAASTLLIVVGTLHGTLVIRRLRPPPFQRSLLLLGAALMVLSGISQFVGWLAHDASVRRISAGSALAAAAAGTVLSLALLREAPAVPQALPQLFVFGVAVAYTWSNVTS